jgi:hypothetical protein
MRLVSHPGELLAVGRTLGLMEPAAPYFIYDCPKCGRRVVDKSEARESKSTSQDALKCGPGDRGEA